jgi:hypothetical protein
VALGGFLAGSLATLVLRRFYAIDRALPAARTVEELRREFSDWQKRYKTAAASAMLGAASLWWAIIAAIAPHLRNLPQTAVYRFLPNAWMWLAPAVFLGLLSAEPVVDAHFRRLLGDRYAEFERFQRLLSGVDERRLWFFKPALLLLCAIGGYLIFDTYAYFTNAEIVTNKFWSLREERHRYSDVDRIETAPYVLERSGRRTRGRPVLIGFKDGSSWSTHSDPSGSAPAVHDALARFVSERSSVRVTEVPFLRAAEL